MREEYGFEREIKIEDETLFVPAIENIAYYEARIAEINERIETTDFETICKKGRMDWLVCGEDSKIEGMSDDMIVEQVVTEWKKEAQACRDAIETIRVDVNLNKPFGHCNDQWETLKSMYQEGDKILHCRSPEWTWKDFVGREGVELQRNGECIYFILIAMN